MTTKALVELQIGKETTWGTPVTPTARVMGVEDATFTPVVEAEVIRDLRGSLAPGYVAETVAVEGAATVEGRVCLPDLVYWLDGLLGESTPSGASAPYTRTWQAPLDAEPAPRVHTLVWGKAGLVYGLAGAVVSKLTISGENRTPALGYSAEFIGKKVAPSSLASLGNRTVNFLRGPDLSLYVDDFGGTIGATALPMNETVFSFSLEIASNRALKGDLRTLEPTGWVKHPWEGRLTLSLELVGTAKAMFEAILAGGPLRKLVRIKAARTNTNGVNEELTLDFAGVALTAPEVADVDGTLTVDIVLSGLVDTGAFGNWLKVEAKTETQNLP